MTAKRQVPQLTLKEARKQLAALGIALVSEGGGEFSVVQADLVGVQREQAKYYTDSLDDALSTGKVMAQAR
jgi:hypothetical protein